MGTSSSNSSNTRKLSQTELADHSKTGPSPLAMLIWLSLLVAGATLFAHWPALSSEALFLDDNLYLTENRLVQNPSWASAEQFLREVLKPSTVGGYYQPLPMISLMLDYAMSTSADSLRTFHRTSLALHVANTVLVVVLLYMLIRHAWVAALVGLLFGVHPMTVETISWVGERKTLLATFFALWCLIVYVRYAARQNWRLLVTCMLLYLLALMSKPTTTPLPVAMLLLDYWPLRRLNKRALLEKMPFLLVGAVSAAVTVVSQRHLELSKYTSFTAWQTLLLMCHNVVFYPRNMVWPVYLSSLYTFPKNISLSNGLFVAGVVANASILLLLILSLRRTRACLTGWLLYCVLLAPTLMNLSYSSSMAWDKYAYLPAVGILLILGWLMERAWSAVNSGWNMRRVGMAAAALTAACLLIVCTRNQVSHWRTSLDLYDYAITLAPESPVLYFTRSAIHGMRRDYDQVIQDCSKAIKIDPAYAYAYHNRGVAYDAKADFAQAIRDFARAIEIKPDYAMAYNSRGTSYYKMQDYDRALRDYTKAIELKNDSSLIYHNRARCYGKMGDYGSAVQDYTRAVVLQPNNVGAYIGRANAYYSLKQYAEAQRDLEMYRSLGGRPSPDFVMKLLDASGRSQ